MQDYTSFHFAEDKLHMAAETYLVGDKLTPATMKTHPKYSWLIYPCCLIIYPFDPSDRLISFSVEYPLLHSSTTDCPQVISSLIFPACNYLILHQVIPFAVQHQTEMNYRYPVHYLLAVLLVSKHWCNSVLSSPDGSCSVVGDPPHMLSQRSKNIKTTRPWPLFRPELTAC